MRSSPAENSGSATSEPPDGVTVTSSAIVSTGSMPICRAARSSKVSRTSVSISVTLSERGKSAGSGRGFGWVRRGCGGREGSGKGKRGQNGAAVKVEWQPRRNVAIASQFGGQGQTSLSIRWRHESREAGDRRPNRGGRNR